MSNEKGHYSLSVATGDSVTLIYSCLGYNKAERILPQVTKDMRLNVQMNYTSLELGEVVATAIRKQTTTLETLNADRVKLLPDPAGGSIESLVVTFAGVTSNNELSSQYSVRGGSYDENIVYVNGLEVFRPLLIRSGQQEGLSFINPDMTEAVNFSAGGFEARYGDKMSSVLDITYKKPKGFEGSASASLLGANAYVGSSSGKFTQVTGFRYKTGRSLLKTTDPVNGGIYFLCIFSQYFSQVVSPYSPAVVKVVQADNACMIGVQAVWRINTLIVKCKSSASIVEIDKGGRKI